MELTSRVSEALDRSSAGSLGAYDLTNQWITSTIGILDPQKPNSLTDHRSARATPPAIPCFRKEPPLGTCHRGGTFYAFRLPQRAAVSSLPCKRT